MVSLSNHEATPLGQKIIRRIEEYGPVPFDLYMDAALNDPEHGYYRHANPIGVAGDFVTAPEVSQTFGEIIGLWAGEVWLGMGSPPAIRLIELGPGRGTLMSDALRALRVLPSFLEALTIKLVEGSAPLREAQAAALRSHICRISWYDGLDEVPPGPAILIANEFLDCLPVRQFVFDASCQAWRERYVDFREGRFNFTLGPEGALPAAPPEEPDDGAILEFRPGVRAVIDELRRHSEEGLCALFIDYGYERQTFGDTVQAVRSHRFADIFDAPGETDLTAHVDFSQLKREAEAAGFTTYGPMPMGEWLLRLGIGARAGQLMREAAPAEAAEIERATARLVGPSQMGALFKVLTLTRGLSSPPPPF